MTTFERLSRNIDTSGKCWNWTGSINASGYGVITVEGKQYKAHRLSYEQFVGPIPPGLQLDHLCRNRKCVRTDHLEPVTCAENLRRGEGQKIGEIQAAKTHCPSGHEYSASNTRFRRSGYRVCRTCQGWTGGADVRP